MDHNNCSTESKKLLSYIMSIAGDCRLMIAHITSIEEIEKYIENNWLRFRQLWEIDKQSFIAVYESENTDLQGLEADIAR